MSIINKLTKSIRNSDYLNGTNETGNAMKLSATGPLLETHQNELKEHLAKISSNFFQNKPSNLDDYENDVLYPEVI